MVNGWTMRVVTSEIEHNASMADAMDRFHSPTPQHLQVIRMYRRERNRAENLRDRLRLRALRIM